MLTLAICDNVFDDALCRAAADAWPDAGWHGWGAVYDSEHQKKRAANCWEDMPAPCKQLLSEMLFLDVSQFGLGALIPDVSLWGGGMHSLSSGGVVGMHLDASHHRQVGLARRLNAILFLNEGWQNGWGGSLQLWDEGRTRPTVEIYPQFRRLVLFASNETSWHAVTPVTCPAGTQRKTLASWWYSRAKGQVSRPQAHFLTGTRPEANP